MIICEYDGVVAPINASQFLRLSALRVQIWYLIENWPQLLFRLMLDGEMGLKDDKEP